MGCFFVTPCVSQISNCYNECPLCLGINVGGFKITQKNGHSLELLLFIDRKVKEKGSVTYDKGQNHRNTRVSCHKLLDLLGKTDKYKERTKTTFAAVTGAIY